MEQKEKGDNRVLTAVIRTMMMLTLFAAVLLFAKIPAYADSGAVLTVQKDGITLKTFSLEELQAIAANEGDKIYDFTAWNTYPTFKEYIGAKGPTITGILKASGIPAESIQDTWTISFMDKEDGGYKKSLTGSQLFEDRFFYPNGKLMDPIEGSMNEDAYSDAVKVPAIVSLTDVHDNYGDTVKNGIFKLYVGQVAPNEQNNPLFVDNLAAGGFIKISTEAAPKCKAVTANPETLTTWRAGKKITLSSLNNYEYDKVYYTLDGTDPDYGSLIYNCAPKQDIELKPALPEGLKSVTLKVIVKGYGKQDSDIQKFVYSLGEPLTVKLDGEVLKTYDRDELDAFSRINAGSAGMNYSGYNSYPTLHNVNIDKGYRVDSIIRDATGKDVLEFGAESTVTFTGSDRISTTLTIGQMFDSERFYYPHAQNGTDSTGGKALPAAYADRKPVPAVIESSSDSQLVFGQIAPNEQNHSEFIKYLLNGGVIEITTSSAQKCDPVSESYPSDGSVINKGEPVRFPIPETYKNRREKLYYIIDPGAGELPGAGCAFYYYGPYHWPEEKINPPVLTSAGHHRISTVKTAYGKKDSDVRVFDFYVNPDVPTGLKGNASTYNSAKLVWDTQAGVSGYRIYRAESGEILSWYKDIDSQNTSFTDKGLKTGKTYKYAIAALAEGKSGVLESTVSNSVSVKPVLGKPTLKLTAGKKKIKLKWSKVSGASGYVVMRSTKKKSGYKKIKTVKKGSTVTFTNTKLKKGKKYYYKVRAYRNISGKKVYGNYSGVKASKAK